MPTGPDATIQTPTVASMHLVKLWKKVFTMGKPFTKETISFGWLVGFVALRPKSTAMVIAGRSVHLTTLFPGQA